MALPPSFKNAKVNVVREIASTLLGVAIGRVEREPWSGHRLWIEGPPGWYPELASWVRTHFLRTIMAEDGAVTEETLPGGWRVVTAFSRTSANCEFHSPFDACSPCGGSGVVTLGPQWRQVVVACRRCDRCPGEVGDRAWTQVDPEEDGRYAAVAAALCSRCA